MPSNQKLSCQELKSLLDHEEEFVLIDVRDPEEFEICRIDGSILVPYNEIQDHIPEFDKDDSYVVHCKGGDLSTKAAKFMRDNGFQDVKTLDGGIHQWAQEIDKRMEIY